MMTSHRIDASIRGAAFKNHLKGITCRAGWHGTGPYMQLLHEPALEVANLPLAPPNQLDSSLNHTGGKGGGGSVITVGGKTVASMSLQN